MKTRFAQRLPAPRLPPSQRFRWTGRRQADFVIEADGDPPLRRYDATGSLEKPKRSEGSFGDHTGYYTLPKPYAVLLPSLFPGILGA